MRVHLTTKEGETGVKPGEVVKPLLNRPPEQPVLPIFSSSQITLLPTTRQKKEEAVAFNWFVFAITGLQQLQDIGSGSMSAADDCESPTRSPGR